MYFKALWIRSFKSTGKLKVFLFAGDADTGVNASSFTDLRNGILTTLLLSIGPEFYFRNKPLFVLFDINHYVVGARLLVV